MFKFNEFKDTVTNLIEAKIELKKLEIQGKIEQAAVELLYVFLMFIIALVVLVFLSIMIAIGLNHLFHSLWLGFLLIFLLYLALLAFMVFKKDTISAIFKRIIEQEVDKRMNTKATEENDN